MTSKTIDWPEAADHLSGKRLNCVHGHGLQQDTGFPETFHSERAVIELCGDRTLLIDASKTLLGVAMSVSGVPIGMERPPKLPGCFNGRQIAETSVLRNRDGEAYAMHVNLDSGVSVLISAPTGSRLALGWACAMT